MCLSWWNIHKLITALKKKCMQQQQQQGEEEEEEEEEERMLSIDTSYSGNVMQDQIWKCVCVCVCVCEWVIYSN